MSNGGYGVRSKKRNQQQAQVTGPDVLMGMVDQARSRGMNPAACHQMEDMLFRMFGASTDGPDDPRNVIARAPMSEAESALAAVIGASFTFALKNADEETYQEVVRVGTVMASRWSEFLEVGLTD